MRSARASVVRLDDKRWRVFVELGRDPATGKRKRLTKVVRGSRTDAEKAKEAMLLKAGDTSLLHGKMTLQDFWESAYLPDCEERLRPNTVHGYKEEWGRFVSGPISQLPFERITPMAIESWLHGVNGDMNRFRAFKLMRQVLNRAKRLDLLQSNPCDRVTPPKKPQDYEPEVLTAWEAVAYVRHFRESLVEPVVLLCLGCGLRRSEAAALDWEDIVGGEVRISHAVTLVGGAAHDDAPKSRFGIRTVVIPAFASQRLEALRGEGPIVKNSRGGRMSPDRLSREYKKLLQSLPEGVKRIPLKNLRHTSLSLALEGGADILAVSRRAGHSGVGITSRYYLRPSKKVDAAAAGALDNLVKNTEMARNVTQGDAEDPE